MKAFESLVSQVQETFRPGMEVVKRRLLGANNERLDFVMDSFYKLTPQQQTGVLAGFAGLLFLLVLVIFGIYFSRVGALEEELNSGFEALREIRSLSEDYKHERSKLEWLSSAVESKTSQFRPKPFFEKSANQVGVTLESLRAEEVNISSDSPLAQNFKEVQVDFRIPKVSIPRMLQFMSELEKANKTLTVRNLRIRSRYGDRLYFDTEAQVVGYKKL